MTDQVPVRLRVEGAASTKSDVLSILKIQADRFFGDERYWLEGDVAFEVEEYCPTMGPSEQTRLRWAGTAYYVNYKER